jgi:hypothetical protein
MKEKVSAKKAFENWLNENTIKNFNSEYDKITAEIVTSNLYGPNGSSYYPTNRFILEPKSPGLKLPFFKKEYNKDQISKPRDDIMKYIFSPESVKKAFQVEYLDKLQEELNKCIIATDIRPDIEIDFNINTACEYKENGFFIDNYEKPSKYKKHNCTKFNLQTSINAYVQKLNTELNDKNLIAQIVTLETILDFYKTSDHNEDITIGDIDNAIVGRIYINTGGKSTKITPSDKSSTYLSNKNRNII